ncbi:MAG: radical SAM protein [Clostridia bacterium]|nr:radical SAM protein [Clostridia bacterium]
MLCPVTALGPGERLCLWVSGCRRRCSGCANPELWEQKPSQAVSVDRLISALGDIFQTHRIDGITITGGEPFLQAEVLCEMLDAMDRLGGMPKDILVFTGFFLEELEAEEETRRLLERIGVLIDGPYERDNNDGVSALRGSSNQRIHYLREDLEKTYALYLQQGRQIQNIVYDYRILSVGIHREAGRWNA